ncbi:MAG: hypothetical protein ACR2M1_14205, partial [Gemmatimonadaceae bacterium]
MIPPPRIPWQVTGNHWVSLPCIHPADGSVHAVGLVSQALRGSVEFAGAEGFGDGEGPPLLRLALTVGDAPIELGASRMAWQRVSEWLPTFNSTIGDLIIRATVFAPYGRGADFPGFVYAISLENRGAAALDTALSAEGTLGLRQHRVRTPRRFTDAHLCNVVGDVVSVSGSDAHSPFALAFAGDEMAAVAGAEQEAAIPGRAVTWSLSRAVRLEPGARVDMAVYMAAGPESDGATAMVARMRQRGWRALADETRDALAALQQTTGVAAVDRLVNRNLVFAYFYCAARALDDARWYLVRSRAPWNGHALTIRDWDSLMWLLPATQLVDPDL